MTPAQRLENLKTVHAGKKHDIIRVVCSPDVPVRQKQLIYACLNNLCQMSAALYSELSQSQGNYDLLEQSAQVDAALLELRTQVGSQIPSRIVQAA